MQQCEQCYLSRNTGSRWNNVANIQKEAVELKNSYSSKNSSLGMKLSAGIGSKGSIKSNGISGNVSQSNRNLNTENTNYQNGNFCKC